MGGLGCERPSGADANAGAAGLLGTRDPRVYAYASYASYASYAYASTVFPHRHPEWWRATAGVQPSPGNGRMAWARCGAARRSAARCGKARRGAARRGVVR